MWFHLCQLIHKRNFDLSPSFHSIVIALFLTVCPIWLLKVLIEYFTNLVFSIENRGWRKFGKCIVRICTILETRNSSESTWISTSAIVCGIGYGLCMWSYYTPESRLLLTGTVLRDSHPTLVFTSSRSDHVLNLLMSGYPLAVTATRSLNIFGT